MQNLLAYFGNEFIDRTRPAQWFCITRVYTLFLGLLFDTFVHPQFLQQIDITLEPVLVAYREALVSSSITRNVVAIGIIATLYTIAKMGDAVFRGNPKPRMHGPLREYLDRYHITTRGFTCVCNSLSALVTAAKAPSLNRSVQVCGLPLVHKQ